MVLRFLQTIPSLGGIYHTNTNSYQTIPITALAIGRRLPAISVSAPVYTILPNGSTNGHMGCHQNRDGDKNFTADWVKNEDSAIVIVRPDMYIGYVGTFEDEAWKGYLDSYFVKSR
ncbi:hypothetical protein IWW34DRAFT_839643 [Fusarium oxysporum f. sp. albedinis]|nr:hypothetical protein IWW34DRAFT_839643 [Fusarium oxysporum f. sp. albedinis]KAJ0141540.1 Endoplasmic reticulum vesicle protein 25 [Fusarium oxysporum f. sp. albedinis]KAK2484147.1 hypothetical protein H9L39_05939 [Fusarium oxysporum f. sp. albedinis]